MKTPSGLPQGGLPIADTRTGILDAIAPVAVLIDFFPIERRLLEHFRRRKRTSARAEARAEVWSVGLSQRSGVLCDEDDRWGDAGWFYLAVVGGDEIGLPVFWYVDYERSYSVFGRAVCECCEIG